MDKDGGTAVQEEIMKLSRTKSRHSHASVQVEARSSKFRGCFSEPNLLSFGASCLETPSISLYTIRKHRSYFVGTMNFCGWSNSISMDLGEMSGLVRMMSLLEVAGNKSTMYPQFFQKQKHKSMLGVAVTPSTPCLNVLFSS